MTCVVSLLTRLIEFDSLDGLYRRDGNVSDQSQTGLQGLILSGWLESSRAVCPDFTD